MAEKGCDSVKIGLTGAKTFSNREQHARGHIEIHYFLEYKNSSQIYQALDRCIKQLALKMGICNETKTSAYQTL